MEINNLSNISVLISLVSLPSFIMLSGFKKCIHRQNNEGVVTLHKKLIVSKFSGE